MNRFTPLTVSGKHLKNRLVVPPMASQTANVEGLATEQTLRHYANLAKANPGLLMVEYSFVDLSGRSETNQLGAHSDACLPGLSEIANVIKQQGMLAGLQLTHCGGKAPRVICSDLMGPSGITVPAYDRVLEKPRAMTREDVDLWKTRFIEAAIRAEKAGFDFVEIHCAHGYGLNQFLSPITNQREDEYGGDQRNRSRLMVEIIQGIAQHTNLTIMARIPGQDLYPEGLTPNQMLETCRYFIEAGLDVLDVSSGIGGWNRPKQRRGQGYLVEESAYIKAADLGVPVIGVGGIEEGDFIDHAIEQQWLDLAAVGRAILHDPEGFAWQQMKQPSRELEPS